MYPRYASGTATTSGFHSNRRVNGCRTCDDGLRDSCAFSTERRSSAPADVTIGRNSNFYFTAVSCSDWLAWLVALHQARWLPALETVEDVDHTDITEHVVFVPQTVAPWRVVPVVVLDGVDLGNERH